MTPLTQQLEDKKKELEYCINNHSPHCEGRLFLKDIIAILEQAIAEIEKQRQEILDKIDSFINYANQEKKDNYLWYKIQLENLKQQLSQSKEEKE